MPVVFSAASNLPWVWSILGLLCIPILVALNGFFVAAEFALVAVRKTRVEELVQQRRKGARAVLAAIENLDRYIAATQLGITLASIALGWAGEPALARLLDPLFRFLPVQWGLAAKHSFATGLAFLFITFMHVVFGELVPKTLALQTPDRTSLWVTRPLLIFAKLTRPLILVMNGTGNYITRLFGFEPASAAEMVHSVEELLLLIEDTQEAGILQEDQAQFVQNVFRLSDKCVRDCLVPRERMATLELHSDPEKVLEAVRSGAHTRMPVHEGPLDNIVGIVNTKDLFYLYSLRGVVVLQDTLYPPLYLDPDETLGAALRLFRQAHRPMALVREKDGRIAGLITLEDIVEEIVGDIEDEHDRPTPKLKLRIKRPAPRPAAPSPKLKPPT